MKAHWVNNGISAAGFDWQGGHTVDPRTGTLVEAVIGDENFKAIWWLELALEAARHVMRIKLSAGSASGFLVAPDIVMTNNHVFEDETDAANAQLQFNYRLTADGNAAQQDDWQCDPGDLFKTSPDLDYSICRVKPRNGSRAGDAWGHFDLRHGAAVNPNQRVNIIQHPRGRFQEIAFRDNQIKHVSSTIVQYVTDTDYGTSGSPVLDDWFNVIALHNQRIPDPNRPGQYYRNQGFNIQAILNDAGSELP